MVRDRILREATALMAARGYAGTSIGAVAAAAGISKPTLVYHFGSKEGLRDAVLTALVSHWQAEIPRLMAAATGSSGSRIDALVGALLDFFRQRPELARLVLRELLDRPEEMGARLRAGLRPWTVLIPEAVRVGQGSGLLRARVDPEAFTVLVISAAVGVAAVGAHTAALMDPEPNIDAQRAELIRMARCALLAPRMHEER